jgi:hypothetical protein
MIQPTIDQSKNVQNISTIPKLIGTPKSPNIFTSSLNVSPINSIEIIDQTPSSINSKHSSSDNSQISEKSSSTRGIISKEEAEKVISIINIIGKKTKNKTNVERKECRRSKEKAKRVGEDDEQMLCMQ